MTDHTAPAAPDALLRAGAPGLDPSDRLSDVSARLRALRLEPGGAQDEVRAEMLAFATAHPDALLRTCPAGHFTGSAVVVDHTAVRTLLLFHRKLQRWLQPGGHADGDANLAAVGWREATEETGIDGLAVDPDPIDLDIHEIPHAHVAGGPPHAHLDVRYLVVAPAAAQERGNHESEALRWVTVDELDGLDLDAGTLRLIHAGFARARARLSASDPEQRGSGGGPPGAG